MDAQRVAVLKTTLVGVDLPASRDELAEYALQERAEPLVVGRLHALPDREYGSLDEIAEEILRVQPPRIRPDPREPHEESGSSPVGDAYVTSPSG